MEYHPHDKKWVAQQISGLPPRFRGKAKIGYESAYLEALDAEPVEHKKENAARFAANSRLRAFVKRVNEVVKP